MHDPSESRTQAVSQALSRARAHSGLSLREIARRAGTSHSTLLAYQHGQKVPSVVVFMRVLDACGMAVDFDLSPRIRDADGIDRGEELKQALLLAAQFPAKPSKTLKLPCFGNG